MKSLRLVLLALPLCLAGCAVSPEQRADCTRVQQSGVSPAIYEKMVHGRPLSISDIEALTRARVRSVVILRYLHNHDVVFYLNDEDVKQLENASVNPRVIDYVLLNSRGSYWSPGPLPYFGAGRFSNDHGFYGGAFSGSTFGGFGWGHHP
jgi:hypothetical protein